VILTNLLSGVDTA